MTEDPLSIFLYIICTLLCIVQEDGATTVPVFAHICTLLVFDDSGCTDIVCATIDCSATANVQNPCTDN